MPPVAGNNFSPVIQHLNNLKDLLDTLSAKLGGVGTEKPTLNVPGNTGTLTPAGNTDVPTPAGNTGTLTPAGNTNGTSPKNNTYTFFGLTKNSTSDNLEKARRNKIKEYHANKHMTNSPENQEKFKGLYSQIDPKYKDLKAIFDARNAVSKASNVVNNKAENMSPDSSVTAVAAIENAKKATTLAIKNGSVENVSKATGAANAAAAAATAAANNGLGNNPLSAINVNALQPNKKQGDKGFVAEQKAKLNAKKGGRRTRKSHTRKRRQTLRR